MSSWASPDSPTNPNIPHIWSSSLMLVVQAASVVRAQVLVAAGSGWSRFRGPPCPRLRRGSPRCCHCVTGSRSLGTRSWSRPHPRRSRTGPPPRPIVRRRISRSRRNERRSTYSTSRLSRSSHETALRPDTCARPVTPGRTSWRRACSRRVPLQVLHQQRPRADQAHVTSDDVPQRGQLVEAGRAQERPSAGHPRGRVQVVGSLRRPSWCGT